MRVHFIAVAGTGMGSLAGLFRAAGHEVSGSDTSFYPPMGPALRAWGIELYEGFDPAHLSPAPDLVVVGNVCRRDNPEARAAIDGGLEVTTMAHALASHILEGLSPLVVAGTHGKTTTSSLAAHLLHEAGRDPGFLIGGVPKNFDAGFRLPSPSARKRLPVAGKSGKRPTPFVVEGDEYDTAFFEKTPKFWHYGPQVGIVTSIELDHIDIYADEAAYDAAFAGFLQRIDEGGLVVAHAASKRVVDLVQAHARADVAYYALSTDELDVSPHWLAAPATVDESGQSFDLYAGGVMAGRAALPLSGEHNLRNAVAAVAAVVQGYGVPVRVAMDALRTFGGVKRRQDLLYAIGGVRVYDDFAHHPTAVRETLAGMRARHPQGRLWAVFEPRSATACRALHQVAYETAFDAADRVILAPVGRPEIAAEERLDTDRIARAVGEGAVAATSIDDILDRLETGVAAGDTVMLLSNGAFGGIYERLRERLARRFETAP